MIVVPSAPGRALPARRPARTPAVRPLVSASTHESSPWAGPRSRRHRPRVRPRPRLHVRLAGQRPCPRSLQEMLGEARLDVDPRALADLPRADRGQERRQQHGACSRTHDRFRLTTTSAGAPRRHRLSTTAASARAVRPSTRCSTPGVAPLPGADAAPRSPSRAAGWSRARGSSARRRPAAPASRPPPPGSCSGSPGDARARSRAPPGAHPQRWRPPTAGRAARRSSCARPVRRQPRAPPRRCGSAPRAPRRRSSRPRTITCAGSVRGAERRRRPARPGRDPGSAAGRARRRRRRPAPSRMSATAGDSTLRNSATILSCTSAGLPM